MMRLATLLLAVSSATAFLAPSHQPQTRVGVASSVAPMATTSIAAIKESSTLTEMDLPKYTPASKEMPKVLGGIKIGLRELVVITGASSGLGLATAVSLAKKGKYFLVLAVRDPEKMKRREFTIDAFSCSIWNLGMSSHLTLAFSC